VERLELSEVKIDLAMILNLQKEIEPFLRTAKEIYIATALINIPGYNFIKSTIPTECISNYIIGIDLPSTPSVLMELMLSSILGKVNAKIYSSEQTYHPKVYIIRNIDNSLTAFIGSANTTNGGLFSNIEMSIKIDDNKQCEDLIIWFDGLYQKSHLINEVFLEKYRTAYKKAKIRQAVTYSDMSNVTKDLQETIGVTVRAAQFFKGEHFEAFENKYWDDDSSFANEKRSKARERFKQLHYAIYSKFREYSIDNLHCHSHTPNIVSLHYHTPFNSGKIDAMWLQYGYSPNELQASKLLDHPRIQLILRTDHIGIWLVIGKDNSSEKERIALKDKLLNDASFAELFCQQLRQLGGSYWIEPGCEDDTHIDEFESNNELLEFILKDDVSGYFIIGRTYSPTDATLSEDNIIETVLIEFQRLFPIYKMVHI
jgi:hypothetical protein